MLDLKYFLNHKRASQEVLVVKNLPANAGDVGSSPGLGRSPGVGNGTPLQCSCLEKSMAKAAWWATVHGIAKESDTTERLSTYEHKISCCLFLSNFYFLGQYLPQNCCSVLSFLSGEFDGQRRLAGWSPWGRKELDVTKQPALLVVRPVTFT